MKLLLVEDEPDIRYLTSLLLELAGHEVVAAGTGDEALRALADSNDFRVVLLDIGLPDISGWEVLAAVRSRHAQDFVRVVVFSAHIGPRERSRALTEGAQGYLTKPFTEEQLLAALADGTAA